MGENPLNQVSDAIENGAVKDIANVLKKVNGGSGDVSEIVGSEGNVGEETSGSTFKVASTNLPEKTGMWTKVKNALFYEIKVELTPYEQKIEDEINEFLHQEITWKSFKSFLLKEVPITFKGKRVF